ncbi:MAG: hypothetical protein F6K41_00255 [Symploca sp. SIO3E6]|nr:hypothetical protein [Caldora sp. SIO3E6]
MSWESEFASQWQKFMTIVESRICQEIDRNQKLDSEFINYIIRSEADKWSISTHYNGAWLRNLKRKYPSLGEEFKAALEELRLDKNLSFNLGLPALRLSEVIVIVCAIGIILILAWLGEPVLRQIVVTVVVALVAFPIFFNLRANQKEKAVNSLVEKIQKELEPTGQKLKNIAVRTDDIKSG